MATKQRSALELDLRKTNLSVEQIEQISHDFRSPLNIIIGFTELMLEEVPGKINAEQRQCLQDVLSASQRLLNLANEVFRPSLIDVKSSPYIKHG